MGNSIGGTRSEDKDSELVNRARNGDKGAYHALVEQYQGRVVALAYGILRSRDDAEDVAQEVFVKVYLCLNQFKGDSAFYTWLYRVTYNMAIDFKRKVGRRVVGAVSYEEELDGKEATSFGEPLSPVEALSRKEDGIAVRRALDEISEDHRAVIVLREVDGLSYDEISRVLGVARGTVMSRLHYARRKLQEVLMPVMGLAARNLGKVGEPKQDEVAVFGKAGGCV